MQNVLGIRVGGESKLRKKCSSFLFFESFFFLREVIVCLQVVMTQSREETEDAEHNGGISEVAILSGQERTRSSM